jgi:hypothetical protein
LYFFTQKQETQQHYQLRTKTYYLILKEKNLLKIKKYYSKNPINLKLLWQRRSSSVVRIADCCLLLKRRQYFIALRTVVWLVSTKQEFFACFWMCFILFLFVFYRVQVSMSFREWSNIFLADQDERQRCFFADQKQFPADHWSLIGRYFEPWSAEANRT